MCRLNRRGLAQKPVPSNSDKHRQDQPNTHTHTNVYTLIIHAYKNTHTQKTYNTLFIISSVHMYFSIHLKLQRAYHTEYNKSRHKNTNTQKLRTEHAQVCIHTYKKTHMETCSVVNLLPTYVSRRYAPALVSNS